MITEEGREGDANFSFLEADLQEIRSFAPLAIPVGLR
jgi:hypothetical protein